jgi:transcriptional regulator with XRE-family HTH domain
MRARKLFIGGKIRAIRGEYGLTQAGFAQKLGISTSYLNQIENNQRHVSASVLLALAEAFSVDITTLSDQDSDRLLADVSEALADPVSGGAQPSLTDVKLVVQNAPSFARAFLSLHQAMRRSGDQLAELDETLERSGALSEPTPYEEVRDFFHYVDNYIHELDLAGEALSKDLAKSRGVSLKALADHIERRHRVRVVIGAGSEPGAGQGDANGGGLRRFDPVSRVLWLNPRTPASTQAFQIACQIALIEHDAAMTRIIDEARFRSADAAGDLPHRPCQLLRRRRHPALWSIQLPRRANCATTWCCWPTASAPASSRWRTAFRRCSGRDRRACRSSLPGSTRPATSPSAIPRPSCNSPASALPARLWNVHTAPSRRRTGSSGNWRKRLTAIRYLCLATTVSKPGGGYRAPVQRYALALGCEVRHAPNWSMPMISTSPATRPSSRSASPAGSANAATATSAPSRRSSGVWSSTPTGAKQFPMNFSDGQGSRAARSRLAAGHAPSG